ncbi:hypothetical protein BCVP_CDS0020 [Bacillus phage BC-VP]|nr:hypothetical protein BCVP_CDS0020 [Bacillus phage BC-VP]
MAGVVAYNSNLEKTPLIRGLFSCAEVLYYTG